MADEEIQSMFRKALELLYETNQRLDEIEQHLDQQETSMLETELGRTSDVQILLKCSRSTVERRRKQEWIEGIHWWQEGDRPIFNLPLIRDWLIHQNDPVTHQRTIDRWARSLTSNQKHKKRA